MIKIIAEAGLNHNGDIKLAKKLVDAASDSGADAVKFQTFWNISRLSKYELTKKEFKELKEYCDSKDIEFMSTPHTFDAIHFLDDLVESYKVASTYVGNINFLKEIAEKGKPMYISTGSLISSDGMMTTSDISNALDYLDYDNIILLHCVSKYPCINPRYERIYTLNDIGYPVGLSDHSKNIYIPDLPIVAIEKHIMLEGIECLDSDVSITNIEFPKMVGLLRRIYQ